LDDWYQCVPVPGLGLYWVYISLALCEWSFPVLSQWECTIHGEYLWCGSV
jgi:hypothetical protein